jgi:sugar phosphate isomerase/epimerase
MAWSANPRPPGQNASGDGPPAVGEAARPRPLAGRLGDELTLCNTSVATLPLRDIVPAAAAAGFAYLSVTARAHRRAVERDGLTNREFRSLLADHGVRVSEVEAAADWAGPLPANLDRWLDPVYDTSRFLDLADELDARTIVVTYLGPPRPAETLAAPFAALCDRAAGSGRQVALECAAMATIADTRLGWEVARLADRRNGGLLVDNWHHYRGTGTGTGIDGEGDGSDGGSSGGDGSDGLADVDPNRVFGVQLSDGTREPAGPPTEDIRHRTLPGEGEMEVAGFLRRLEEHGVRCPVGIEVLRGDIVAGGAHAAAIRLHAALHAVVQAARASG